MNNYGNIVLNLTTLIVTLWIVKRFLDMFFKRKKINVRSGLTWITFTVFQVSLLIGDRKASIWTTLISIIIVFIIALNGYSKAGKMKLIYVILLYVIWSLLEMLTFYNLQSVSFGDMYIIGSVISKILMIIVINVLHLFLKDKDLYHIATVDYVLLLCIPCGSIYIAVNEFFRNGMIITSMITFSILLLINITIFDLYTKLAQNFVLQNEKTVYEQQIDIITKSTEAQKKLMDDFYLEKHNMINQLIALKYSVEHESREDILESLNYMIHRYDLNENILDSGNGIVNALINFKFMIAKEHGILFHLKIFIPDVLPVKQCDLGVILGNAIDNAIEAVKKCSNSDKIIKIYMGIKKESLIIVIKNPYEHSLKKDKDGDLVTTKGSIHHGYGIVSIKRVAEEYNGEVLIDTETDKNWFILTIVLNLENF